MARLSAEGWARARWQGRPHLCTTCSAAAKMLSRPRISQHPALGASCTGRTRTGDAHGFPLSHALKREDRPPTGDPTSPVHTRPPPRVEACPRLAWGAMCPLHWRATSSPSGKTSTTCTARMHTRVGTAAGPACAGPTRLPVRYVRATALKEGRGPTLAGNVEAASPSLSPTVSPRLQGWGARGRPAALGVLGRMRHASELFQLHHCSHTTHTHTHRRV